MNNVNSFPLQIIEERSKEPPKQLESGDGLRKTRIAFLDLLLKMHREDPSFTFKDIREEVDTFMFEVLTKGLVKGWSHYELQRLRRVATSYRKNVSERTSNVRHSYDY